MEHDCYTYFNAANVSATSFKDTMIFLPELAEYIQAPSVPLPDQAKNGGEVVGENDEAEPAAVDQPCGLEDLIILFSDDPGTTLCVCRDNVWVLPRFAFIDFQELLGNVLDVMKGRSD